MILDSLKNKAQYAALHPRFQTAALLVRVGKGKEINKNILQV